MVLFAAGLAPLNSHFRQQHKETAMAPKDLLLALVVVIAWGINFVVIKVGLHGVPPMLLGALRFGLAALPAVFFVKRPQMPWRWLLAYGATISFGQFAFLFSAMYVGMPAGLASLVLQAQAFFTLIFAGVFLHERFRAPNVVGLAIASGGLAVIGMQGGHAMTLAGFVLTLCAAGSWALGNIVTKKVGKVDLVGLVVWGSLIPPLPFLALSYAFEGPQRIVAALSGIGATSIFAVVYLAFIATLLGYSLWSRLLARYPASQVAPFSLLVPIVGLASASVFLDEHLTTPQIAGAALVMAGLAVNVFGGWLVRRFVPAR
jgi:O-acetylserine/cysteine efflux transporter